MRKNYNETEFKDGKPGHMTNGYINHTHTLSVIPSARVCVIPVDKKNINIDDIIARLTLIYNPDDRFIYDIGGVVTLRPRPYYMGRFFGQSKKLSESFPSVIRAKYRAGGVVEKYELIYDDTDKYPEMLVTIVYSEIVYGGTRYPSEIKVTTGIDENIAANLVWAGDIQMDIEGVYSRYCE